MPAASSETDVPAKIVRSLIIAYHQAAANRETLKASYVSCRTDIGIFRAQPGLESKVDQRKAMPAL
jgi:hypothetical protein